MPSPARSGISSANLQTSRHRDSLILGWGMAGCAWVSARFPAEANVQLRDDGSARVASGTQDIGTGTYTILALLTSQKTGVPLDSAAGLIDEVAEMLDLRGLMAMGPTNTDPTPAFVELRKLREGAQQRLGKALPILSMGMSGDFEPAVKAGSTMLRLGQALFGPRPAR